MKTSSATESQIQREGVRAILTLAFIIAAWLYLRVKRRGYL